ncbi:MAG TPA: DUF58 domain-containing protein [Actinomycetes bacterium]|nr:DUF58 domain-containing protein [Actinomycetes bacterium]
MNQPLSWQLTAHARRLATTGVLLVGSGVVLGRSLVAAAGMPFLVLLAYGLTARRPDAVDVAISLEPDERTVEGERIELQIAADAGVPVDLLAVHLPLSSGLREPATDQDEGPPITGSDHATAWRPPRDRRAVPVIRRGVAGAGRLDEVVELAAGRWGRWTVGPAGLAVRTGGGTLQARVHVPVGEIAVYPAAGAHSAVLNIGRLPNRVGDHASRALGEGIEFAGIAEHVAGLSQRRVNWPVSTRRGQLHVNRFATERALDLVLALDAFSDVGEYGRSSLDVSLRGAVGLAQSYLRRQDRVGLVAIGGILRWLAPDVGQRQLYRIAEQLLWVRLDTSFVGPDLERVPRTALPPGALVVLFSPLLDRRAAEAARELRERGHPVVVIDVLTVEPQPARGNRLGGPALRLWRLDRMALHRELSAAGVACVRWDGVTPLDAVLTPLARVPLAARSS